MSDRKLRFDGWVLDPESGDLERGGTRIRLQEQPVQILRELTANAGSVVPRERLIMLLWPKGVVDFDTGLNTVIRKLRSALGDTSETPRYIETLPRRGYRFIGALDPDPETSPAASASTPVSTAAGPPARSAPPSPDEWTAPATSALATAKPAASGHTPAARDEATLSKATATAPVRRPRSPLLALIAALVVAALLAGVYALWSTRLGASITSIRVEAPSQSGLLTNIAPTGTAAFSPPPHSIAVLPFVNMSGDKEQEYFSDGLTEELIDMLSKVSDLRVPARTSSFYFKGKPEDISTIAQRLHVANVLEGSVRKSGNALRVTAQLIRADNGYHLWSETYDRELKDVFKVQDDIAGAVVTALKVHLLPAQSAAQAELRTGNTEAYNLYLQGRQSFNRGDSQGYQLAVTAFSAATTLDPHYAAAYAALALAQIWVADSKEDYEIGYQSALASANKAVALAPELGTGYAARGFVHIYSFDLAGAMADLDKAVALSPHDAEVLHRSAVVLAILGNLPAAIAREKEAFELDPLSAEICMRLGFFYAANQQLAEARSMYEKALAMAPNSIRALWNLGRLDLLENRPEQALAAFRQSESKGWRLAGQAMVEYSLGHADASQRLLKQLIAIDDTNEVALVYAWRGENDDALEWLERTYAKRDPAMAFIKIMPEFRGLRGDARYVALLRKMNLAE